MTFNEIEQKSLELTANDRIRLVEKLIASLDKPDPEIEAAWIKESEARLAAYEKGELKTVPLEKVLGELKRK